MLGPFSSFLKYMTEGNYDNKKNGFCFLATVGRVGFEL